MGLHHSPCVMSNTDQFFVKICPCGVVHLSFGATILNATAETVVAITETLKEVSSELRQRMACDDPVNGDQVTFDPLGNVVKGRFPSTEL